MDHPLEAPISARALWSAVVLLAVKDLEEADIGSVDYHQACSFFVAAGGWAESRLAIADCLEMHVNDVERIGTRAIAARRMLEGLPAEVVRAVAPPLEPQAQARRRADDRPARSPLPGQLPRATFTPVLAKRRPEPNFKIKWNWDECAVNPLAVKRGNEA